MHGAHRWSVGQLRVEAGIMVDITDPNSTLLTFATTTAEAAASAAAEVAAAAAAAAEAASTTAAQGIRRLALGINSSANDTTVAASVQAPLRAMNWTRIWGRHGAATHGESVTRGPFYRCSLFLVSRAAARESRGLSF